MDVRRVQGVCMHRDRVRVGAVMALSLSSLVVAVIVAGCSFGEMVLVRALHYLPSLKIKCAALFLVRH